MPHIQVFWNPDHHSWDFTELDETQHAPTGWFTELTVMELEQLRQDREAARRFRSYLQDLADRPRTQF